MHGSACITVGFYVRKIRLQKDWKQWRRVCLKKKKINIDLSMSSKRLIFQNTIVVVVNVNLMINSFSKTIFAY